MIPPRERLGPVNRQGLAVLRHADQRSSWAIVLIARLETPLSTARLDRALAAVHRNAPLIGARLAGEAWWAGPAPRAVEGPADPLSAPRLTLPFDLGQQAPLRVMLGDGQRLALVGHHAAFDGRALVSVASEVLREAGGAQPTRPASPGPVSVFGDCAVDLRAGGPGGGGTRGAIRGAAALAGRLARPVDRVAPGTLGGGDAFAARQCQLAAHPRVTARLAAAAVAAVGAFNRQHGYPWRRIGLSIGVGAPSSGRAPINTASFRRVDVDVDDDIDAAVTAALAAGGEPPELVNLPRFTRPLLSPVVERLSDSLLVSNLGRIDVPGTVGIEFYPVARGRSAVAVGAAGRAGQPAVVTLRARDLGWVEANKLLDEVMLRLLDPSSATSAP